MAIDVQLIFCLKDNLAVQIGYSVIGHAMEGLFITKPFLFDFVTVSPIQCPWACNISFDQFCFSTVSHFEQLFSLLREQTHV